VHVSITVGKSKPSKNTFRLKDTVDILLQKYFQHPPTENKDNPNTA